VRPFEGQVARTESLRAATLPDLAGERGSYVFYATKGFADLD
jgi:hypothetical protein